MGANLRRPVRRIFQFNALLFLSLLLLIIIIIIIIITIITIIIIIIIIISTVYLTPVSSPTRTPCGANNIGAYFTFTPWGIMIYVKIPNVRTPPIVRKTPLNDTTISER